MLYRYLPESSDPFTMRDEIHYAQTNVPKQSLRGFLDEYGPATAEHV
jgi:hypothetical protein